MSANHPATAAKAKFAFQYAGVPWSAREIGETRMTRAFPAGQARDLVKIQAGLILSLFSPKKVHDPVHRTFSRRRRPLSCKRFGNPFYAVLVGNWQSGEKGIRTCIKILRDLRESRDGKRMFAPLDIA